MHQLIKLLTATCLTLVTSSNLSAQNYGMIGYYSGGRYWLIDPYKSRFTEIGPMVGFLSPKCEAFHFVRDRNGVVKEKKVWGDLKGVFSYGGIVGTGIHVAKLDEKSSIAFNFSIAMNYIKTRITEENVEFEKGSQYIEKVEMMTFHVPIGIDYKVGAEAVSDKYLKTMYTLGAGVSPYFGMIGNGTADGFSPYIKAEVGYHLGFAVKLRAMYMIGKQNLYHSDFQSRVKSDVDNTADHRPYFKLSHGGNIFLSLIIMPYSYTWED